MRKTLVPVVNAQLLELLLDQIKYLHLLVTVLNSELFLHPHKTLNKQLLLQKSPIPTHCLLYPFHKGKWSEDDLFGQRSDLVSLVKEFEVLEVFGELVFGGGEHGSLLDDVEVLLVFAFQLGEGLFEVFKFLGVQIVHQFKYGPILVVYSIKLLSDDLYTLSLILYSFFQILNIILLAYPITLQLQRLLIQLNRG